MSLFESLTQVGQFLLFFFLGIIAFFTKISINKLAFAINDIYKTNIQLKFKKTRSCSHEMAILRLNTQLELKISQNNELSSQNEILMSARNKNKTVDVPISQNFINRCLLYIKGYFLIEKQQNRENTILKLKRQIHFLEKSKIKIQIKKDYLTLSKNISTIIFYIVLGLIFIYIHLNTKYMNYFLFLPIATLCGILFGNKIVDIFHCK